MVSTVNSILTSRSKNVLCFSIVSVSFVARQTSVASPALMVYTTIHIMLVKGGPTPGTVLSSSDGVYNYTYMLVRGAPTPGTVLSSFDSVYNYTIHMC